MPSSVITMQLTPQPAPSSKPQARPAPASAGVTDILVTQQSPQATAQEGVSLPGQTTGKQGNSNGEGMSGAELDQAVEELNNVVQNIRRELNFSVDKDSGRTVIRVTDSATQEVIREIPSEEVLNLIAHLKEFDSGLFKEEA